MTWEVQNARQHYLPGTYTQHIGQFTTKSVHSSKEFKTMSERATFMPALPQWRARDPGAALVGIGLAGMTPIVSDTGPHNMGIAIRNRVISETDPYDTELFEKFERFVADNLTTIFGPSQIVRRQTHETWNRNFPMPKQKRHNRAKQEWEAGYLPKNAWKHPVFVKREKLQKTSLDYTPRCISPCSDIANVMLGPWMGAFYPQLKKRWSVKNPITFGSGHTPLSLGEWCEQFFHGDYCDPRVPDSIWDFYEDDFSEFDKTQHCGMYRIARKVFDHFGLSYDTRASYAYLRQLRTESYSKWGHRFTIMATMKSGCSNTTLQNSIINALVHLFSVVEDTGKDLDAVMRECRFLVNGDDNAFATPKEYTNPEAVAFILRRLGLVPKLNRVRLVDMRVNGGNFSPVVHEGRTRLAHTPLFGRLGGRMGWAEKRVETTDAWMHAVCLGMEGIACAVPFLRHLVTRTKELSTGYTAKQLKAAITTSKNQLKKYASDCGIADEVWFWERLRSGLGQDDELGWKMLLGQTTLGNVVGHHSVDAHRGDWDEVQRTPNAWC